MTLHLYDTLRREKVEFEPQIPGKVTMYLCGPTVYNYAHIGNARPAVIFDVLARLLRRDYALTFARNITDVDDKINAASVESGKPIDEITARFIAAYNDDMAALGVQPPDVQPRATEHIEEMVDMIATLVDKGFAYAAQGHVLFDVSSFDDYGKLSKRDLREMLAGARVEVAPYKRAPHDFVMWKPSTPELPGWDSPWGRGRPGWHIECSAMSAKHLGRTIDIHAGGQDLVFPHHENELAQSACAHNGEVFARFWLHNGFVSVDSTKMSKSLGNVLLVHEMVRTIPGEVIRMALLSAHYRQPLNWSDDIIESARKMLDRLYGALRGVDLSDAASAEVQPHASVLAAIEDDLNTPKALSEIFSLVNQLNKTEDTDERCERAAVLRASSELLGVVQGDVDAWFHGSTDGNLSIGDIEALIARRNSARAKKDFAAADRVRDELAASGIAIEDGPSGTRWRRDGSPQ
jgi:cysteinyl-tRNA synthetase